MNSDASTSVDTTFTFGGKIPNMVLIMRIGLALGALRMRSAEFSPYRSIAVIDNTGGRVSPVNRH